jgi:hypothetical protein
LKSKPDPDGSNQLSESEVAAISQFLSIEQTVANPVIKAGTGLKATRKQSPAHLGLPLFIDFVTFYAIVVLAQAVLDVEDLNSGLQFQIQYYLVSYFWLDISVAMTLVAVCVWENLRLRPARWFGSL